MFSHLVFAALAAATAVAKPNPPPDVTGPYREADWRGAPRVSMVGGGELRLLHSGKDVYIAVKGPTRGYPSLCVGSARRVEILHASAALGTVVYARVGDAWRLQQPFAWRLRERGRDDRSQVPFAREQAAFYQRYRWISTASRAGDPVRMFRIGLTRARERLGVVFLDTAAMRTSYWPASMGPACRDLSLVKGDAADRLAFDPSSWSRIEH